MKTVLLFLFFCLQANAQTECSTPVNDSTGHFFLEQLGTSGIVVVNQSDGAKITLSATAEGRYFQADYQLPNSYYTTKKTYFTRSGNLRSCTNYFGNMPIGIRNEYDSTGIKIDSINYDAPYKLSHDDLLKLLKTRFKLDALNDKDHRYEIRRGQDNTPSYSITVYPWKYSEGKMGRELTIDATTGKTLTDRQFKLNRREF